MQIVNVAASLAVLSNSIAAYSINRGTNTTTVANVSSTVSFNATTSLNSTSTPYECNSTTGWNKGFWTTTPAVHNTTILTPRYSFNSTTAHKNVTTSAAHSNATSTEDPWCDETVGTYASESTEDVGKAVFSAPKFIKLSDRAIEVALEKVFEKYPSLQGKINAADVTPNEDIFISVNGIGYTDNE